jgi:DNA-binding protein HU-beta
LPRCGAVFRKVLKGGNAVREVLVARMAKDAGVSKRVADAALRAFTSGVKQELVKGNRVAIAGFGSFIVRKSSPRVGRNPKTGKTIQIPAGRRPVFRPGKALKDAVARKK